MACAAGLRQGRLRRQLRHFIRVHAAHHVDIGVLPVQRNAVDRARDNAVAHRVHAADVHVVVQQPCGERRDVAAADDSLRVMHEVACGMIEQARILRIKARSRIVPEGRITPVEVGPCVGQGGNGRADLAGRTAVERSDLLVGQAADGQRIVCRLRHNRADAHHQQKRQEQRDDSLHERRFPSHQDIWHVIAIMRRISPYYPRMPARCQGYAEQGKARPF